MEEPKPLDEERRQYPLFPLYYPILFSGDLLEGEGTVINISKVGCAVRTDKPVEPGAHLTLFLHILEAAVPLKIELAVVRWARGGVFGVDFISISPTEQERLHEVIKFLEMRPST